MIMMTVLRDTLHKQLIYKNKYKEIILIIIIMHIENWKLSRHRGMIMHQREMGNNNKKTIYNHRDSNL